MALISCYECGKEISDKAASCPGCGAPVLSEDEKAYEKTLEKAEKSAEKNVDGCLVFVVFFLLFISIIVIANWSYISSPPKENLYKTTTSVSTAQKEALKETIALIINIKGYLCAKVEDIRPLSLKNRYEVTCIEYRGGSSTKSYIIDTVNNKVTPQ